MWIILIIVASCVGLYILVKRATDSPGVPLETTNFKNTPKTYAFNIVGEQAFHGNLERIAGQKEEESKKHECFAKVISEPTNAFDKSAIKVEINGLTVGYLSKEDAKKLAGNKINITVPALIDGGWLDYDSEGSYGVKLAINSIKDLVQ